MLPKSSGGLLALLPLVLGAASAGSRAGDDVSALLSGLASDSDYETVVAAAEGIGNTRCTTA